MSFYDWPIRRKLKVLGAMLGISAVFGLSFVLLYELYEGAWWQGPPVSKFFVPFLFFLWPQVFGFNLYLGLRTGILPMGVSFRAHRAEHPFDYWFGVIFYVGVLAMWLWPTVAIVLELLSLW